MKQPARYTVLTVVALSACFAAGCGKPPAGPAGSTAPPEVKAAVAAASQLPGADEVTAALEKKDYEGAMAALLRVKQVARTDEQKIQFTTLAWDLKTKLMGAAETDPKAGEALMALRAMTMGR